VSKKVIEVGENQLTMMIWDILGQKAHSSLHEAYYKGAHGALLVSDLTQEATVLSLRRWKEELIAVTGGIPIIPVANKYDLEGRVSDEVLRDAEERIGRPFVITSAKTGEGVEQAFLDLAERILEGRI
jgi:small GTP-binding protein